MDENLMRNELHYILADKSLLRRKEIYEELYPETKHNSYFKGNQYMSPNENISVEQNPTFTEDTAAKLGVTQRTVETSVQRANNLTEVPCVVYDENEVNIYKLAGQLNASNDTYAKQDLFDVLYKIGKLKDEKHSGKEIADILGWNESSVKNYSTLLTKVTPILENCKSRQMGRVTAEVTDATFDFTEYWFRSSGLYELTEEFQILFFNKFKEDKFIWNKSKAFPQSFQI